MIVFLRLLGRKRRAGDAADNTTMAARKESIPIFMILLLMICQEGGDFRRLRMASAISSGEVPWSIISRPPPSGPIK